MLAHGRCLCVAMALFLGCVPCVAGASWPLEKAGTVLLEYGAEYDRAGMPAVHRGIDIACESGTIVVAPTAGEVTFAGMVPGETGRVIAVTLATADGLRVTCMPLEASDVAAGDAVGLGDPLGTVSPTGDLSSAESHIHVSVRRGDTYLDPADMIGSAPAVDVLDEGVVPIVVLDSQPTLVSPPSAANAGVQESTVALSSAPELVPVPLVSAARTQGFEPVAESLPADPEPSCIPEPASAPPTAESMAQPSGVAASAARGDVSRSLAGQDIPRTMGADIGGVSSSPSSRRRFPRGVLTAALSVLAAAIGLWPLWRRASHVGFLHGVSPTLDDVAAAVGR